MGAPGAAKVFIFKLDSNGDIPTTATAIIDAYTSESGFGVAVSLSATHLAVGAYNAAKAFIFKLDSNGDIPTTATAIIDGYTSDAHFGCAVSLSATHLAVGAADSAKKVFIFKKN